MTDIQDGPPIEIYLGEEQLEIRRMLRSALRAIQLDIYEDFETCEPLRDAVDEGLPDLIIVDSDLAGGNARNLIRDIRHSELGKNPFVPVIVTTWRNTKEKIRELMDIGADGLLIKPISINAIQSHVNFIVNERKPFIVTSSYIGPDRRKDPQHTSTVPLIEVPNTLKAKISGEPIDFGALRQQIDSRNKEINVERLRRNAFELSFLVELALASHASDESDGKLRTNLKRLHRVIGDTIDRLHDSDYEDSRELCETLLRVVTTLVESDKAPAPVDLQFLKPLTDGILVGFYPERTQSDMTLEIIKSINLYQERLKARSE